MNAFILSIIGISFMGVMIDVIAPSGKTNTFIKSIFGIFVVFVIVSGIYKVFNANYSFDYSNNEVFNNSDYYMLINESTIKTYQNNIEKDLEKNGITEVFVSFCGNVFEINYKIEKVYVDIKNIVISPEFEHINKYEVIKSTIYKVINNCEVEVEFYE